ncbi:MAG: ABC transporter permease [Gemmatimonadales bacterium]
MISQIIARFRSLWRGIRRRSDVEAEMNEEFRLHLELRAADLVRSGLSLAEAARQARLEFGHGESHKQAGRAARGLGPFDELRVSWLDFKLGFRMLVRYPGLTVVGGFAFAFAILVGAGVFEFSTQVVNPTLPLDEGDRIVALRNLDALRPWDATPSRAEARALHDFVTWRDELKSVEDLGAYRTLERNLITAGGLGRPVDMAEISASAFRVARVPPLLGRSLVEADEHAGAPPVVVIGYDVWQARFAGDSSVVGRTVRLGAVQTTVVGVMPEGFAFPVAHSLWAPFRLNVSGHERYEGPRIQVFGRLAPGVTLGEAKADLTTWGQRAAVDDPQTYQHLRPHVVPYPKAWLSSITSGEFSLTLISANLFVVMLLVLMCANVALLMFARAATRVSEVVVRTALGASRGRIITQLFAEALVLGGVAAVVGLAAAGFGLRWGFGMVEAEVIGEGGRLPFWFSASLSPTTMLYSVVLTLLGAGIAGVVPGLNVTRGLQARLRAVTAGGGGLRFGRLWTAVIMTQVALTVAFPAVAFYVERDAARLRTYDLGFPAAEYLSVRLELDRDRSPGAAGETSRTAFLARYGATYQQLKRRLMTEPAVTGVTAAEVLPLMYHEWNQIEVDQGALTPRDSVRGHRVSSAAIEADYFDVLGTPILAGRAFHSGDVASAARVVIVNRPFVDQVLGGRNPVGRRVRYLDTGEWSDEATDAQPTPWYEIVGVVRDLGTTSGYGAAGIYHPLDRQTTYPVHLAIHVRGDPASFAPRVRAVAAAVDPTLRLYAVMPLNEVINSELQFYGFWFRLTLLVSAIALLLSLAGIYAVMSFTVARRTREIGIRVALGADPRRILASIFRRPLIQVALGVVAGSVLVAALVFGMYGGALSARQVGAVAAYAALMMGVCMLACVVPTRRALRVQPTDALRADT